MVRTVELHLLLRGYSASAQPVTRMHWELATRLSGDYRGRTFTGKLMVTSRHTKRCVKRRCTFLSQKGPHLWSLESLLAYEILPLKT